MMSKAGWCCLAVMAALLGVATPGVAREFLDDVCPDAGGNAFIVDTPVEARSVANGYNLPTCHLVLRTSLDPGAIDHVLLQITARSITIEGPLEINNALVDSAIVLRVLDGDIALSQARLMARDTIRLECHGSTACNITIAKHSHLQAPRVIRVAARGRLTIEDTRIVGGELDVRAASSQ
jgi:hypothetical protein